MSSEVEAPGEGADEFGREILRRIKAGAAARGAKPRRRRDTSGLEPRPRSDSRDPILLGDSLETLIGTRGWTEQLSVAGVMTRWPQIAGEQIAGHSEPVDFTDGILTLRASSTAWATQLQLLTGQILQAIARDLGDGVVTDVKVVGPAARSFKRGPKAVRGRGPRDTWG
ncbi:DciA family protein [Rarobacter faecitabidus]|uniref:Putative nucleic acid-binding Zn ribbon protein n=1 Tax=Rarobacter faecitabidus TaxID=13243 RepID=A0A542ZPA3_RARFA|nr:DciA family protein [Rarobacter faecitabidus]TQL62204.1 putative nucleic acid-binding Zn ribbon protein [Rarobacter faecitabidus]